MAAIVGPNLKHLLSLYTEDRRDGFGRYHALLRFISGLWSLVLGRARHR